MIRRFLIFLTPDTRICNSHAHLTVIISTCRNNVDFLLQHGSSLKTGRITLIEKKTLCSQDDSKVHTPSVDKDSARSAYFIFARALRAANRPWPRYQWRPDQRRFSHRRQWVCRSCTGRRSSGCPFPGRAHALRR